MEYDVEIDAIGLLCPWPVLKVEKALRALATGQVVKLMATDPVAVIDIPHFCNETGHNLLDSHATGDTQVFFIRKA